MIIDGILIGAGAFFIIGALHPVVIKAEYHLGKRVWPIFLLFGIACIALSLFTGSVVASAILAVLGFSLLWSIRELFEQGERVKKGWYPKKPQKGRKRGAVEE